MAIAWFTVSFFLSCLLVANLLAEAQNTSESSCQQFFPCGNLQPDLTFPFSRLTQPSCGLLPVNCSAQPYPKIQLAMGRESYEITEIVAARMVRVRDPFLEQELQNRSCRSFFNTSFSSTPSISFMFYHNLSLIRCPDSQFTESPQFMDANYSYQCEGFTYHYTYPKKQGSIPSDIPRECSVIHVPIEPPDAKPNASDLFTLVTAEFYVWFYVHSDCSNCHRQGNLCGTDRNRNFQCVSRSNSTITGLQTGKNGEGKKRLELILGTVLPGTLLLIIAVVLINGRHRKRVKLSSYPPSANKESSGPFLRRDLEGRYFEIPIFSYTELDEATNNFDSSNELGDGGFGAVYYGKLRDGREVAVKCLYQRNWKRMEQFRNEIEILTRLRHQNLVTLYGCTSRDSRELLIVYEYIPNGTVADHLHGERAKDGSLTWPIRMKIALETANALSYLHASDVIHRDVKTNNILLDQNFCVKVADFGISRLLPNDVTHVSTAPQGTPGYVDPEYYESYRLTDKSDVYSFGVVLIELISSMPAVDITRNSGEINLANLAINRIERSALNELVDQSLGSETDSEISRMTTSVAEVAFRCLRLQKEMRPTMQEVLGVLKEIQNGKDLVE